MSAFLFQLSHKHVKAMDTNELEARLKTYKEVVDAYDWKNYRQCSFKGDQAVGFKANVALIEEELEQRKKGVDEPLEYLTVIGYNPKQDFTNYPKRTGK